MKDYLGNTLNVGDKVAFIPKGSRQFREGTVVKITPKFAFIENPHRLVPTFTESIKQAGAQIIKLIKQ